MSVAFVGESESDVRLPPAESIVELPLPLGTTDGDLLLVHYELGRDSLWSLATPQAAFLSDVTLSGLPPVTVTPGPGLSQMYLPGKVVLQGILRGAVNPSTPDPIQVQSRYNGIAGPAGMSAALTVWRGVEQMFVDKTNGGPEVGAHIPGITVAEICDVFLIQWITSAKPGDLGWDAGGDAVAWPPPANYLRAIVAGNGGGSDTSADFTFSAVDPDDPGVEDGYWGAMTIGLSDVPDVDPPDPPPDPEYGQPDQPPVPPANPLGDLLSPASIATEPGPDGTDLIVPAYPYRLTKEID